MLIAGVVFLIVKLAGGSGSTPTAPDKGFKPVLPQKTTALTSNGVKVTSYAQLPSEVKQAIVGFVVPGVLHNNYGPSWKYTAPNITRGASQQKWATVDARSVIPLPGYTLDGVTYKLEEATTKEVLVTLTPAAFKAVRRPADSDADRAHSDRQGRGQALARELLVAGDQPCGRPLQRQRRIGRS